jgi:transposase
VNRRTWAPRGETPVQRSWDRHDRLSVISAVTLSPQRHRISLPFQIRNSNIVADDAVSFIKSLRRQLRRPLIVILDRWSVHRSAVKRLQEAGLKGLDFEWLPGYAPELNPVEARWSNTKYADLANYVPDDVGRLRTAVRTSLRKQAKQTQLQRSFFHTAKLKL